MCIYTDACSIEKVKETNEYNNNNNKFEALYLEENTHTHINYDMCIF